MHNTPTDLTKHLFKMVSEVTDLPEDDYNHQEFLKPLKFLRGTEIEANFRELVEDKFLYDSKGGRNEVETEKLRHHWHVILMNLAMVMYQRHWLLVPGDSKYYTGNYWAQRLGLGYRPIQTVIQSLKSNDFIDVLPGRKYEGRPMLRRIYPKPFLQELLFDYFLYIEQPIEGPYVSINKPDNAYKNFKFPKDHPEVIELTEVNEFLKGHMWAFKGPVALRYKHTPFQGGRLYTPFQNLPDRKSRVRINTRINDQPIAEVDFSCNHLRLNLAYQDGIDAGETPYEDIGELAGGLSRDSAKTFITVAMGASDQNEARSALTRKRGYGDKAVKALIEATNKRFPTLELFSGWGLFAQNLEGQILKDVLLEGVKKDIVCLPVHDAVAVQQQHIEWAKEQMVESWNKITGTEGLSRVKVDTAD